MGVRHVLFKKKKTEEQRYIFGLSRWRKVTKDVALLPFTSAISLLHFPFVIILKRTHSFQTSAYCAPPFLLFLFLHFSRRSGPISIRLIPLRSYEAIHVKSTVLQVSKMQHLKCSHFMHKCWIRTLPKIRLVIVDLNIVYRRDNFLFL